MAIGISPALPLVRNQNDGPYRLTKSLRQAITQNFKNLLLTNPGERMMDPDFGVGIKRYLFELENSDLTEQISEKINQQANKYMSNTIKVLDIRYTRGSDYRGDIISAEDSNSIYMHILFRINPLQLEDVLSIPINRG